jgi:hypothetical protein
MCVQFVVFVVLVAFGSWFRLYLFIHHNPCYLFQIPLEPFRILEWRKKQNSTTTATAGGGQPHSSSSSSSNS